MAEVTESFKVGGAPEAVLDAIAKGAEGRGMDVDRAGPSKLALAKGTSAWSFEQNLTVEAAPADGGTEVFVHGKTFGAGPIVKQGPKKSIEEIREDAERA